MSLAVEQASFQAAASLIEASSIPKATEDDFRNSAPAQARSSAVEHYIIPEILLFPGTQISMTLKRPERRSRQQQHDNLGLIHNFRQRSYGSLTTRKD